MSWRISSVVLVALICPSVVRGALIELRLSAVASPTEDESVAAYPDSLTHVAMDSQFYLEAWMQDVGTPRAGISSGYLDVAFDTAYVNVTALHHGSIYTFFPSGSIDDSAGLVDEFGGSYLAGNSWRPGRDEWVLLGRLTLIATDPGEVWFTPQEASDDEFARFSAGAAGWGDVDAPAVMLVIGRDSHISSASGNWNAGSTWDAGIPPTTDDHVKVLGHTVTVAADGEARSLLISHSDGAVVIDPGVNLTVVEDVEVAVGTLGIGLADSASGRLASGGTVNLGGTLSLSATAASFPSVAIYTETVVTGTINGTFNAVPAADEHLGGGGFYKSIAYSPVVSVEVLQAISGDANGDQAFNFDDLVQMFSASGAVYGNPSPPAAVDWPGGDFTDDQAFTFADLVKAFGDAGAHYGAASYPAADLGTPQGGAVSLVYDQATGQLSIDAGDVELVALSIESAAALLEITPEAEGLLDGLADIASSGQFAKLDLSGMSSLDFGAALSAMLSESDLLADLTVTGALLGGGTIEDVSLNVVPEPGTFDLLVLGTLALVPWLRRRAARHEARY